jgi:hypothetical protein
VEFFEIPFDLLFDLQNIPFKGTKFFPLFCYVDLLNLFLRENVQGYVQVVVILFRLFDFNNPGETILIYELSVSPGDLLYLLVSQAIEFPNFRMLFIFAASVNK